MALRFARDLRKSECVRWRHGGAQCARHRRAAANRSNDISAPGRTWRYLLASVQFDIRSDVGRIIDGISDLFMHFYGNLLHGGVDLPQVVDTTGGLRVCAGSHVVRYGNAGQKADNDYHYHDFYQCKPAQTNFCLSGLHTLLTRCEQPADGFIIYDYKCVHGLPAGTAVAKKHLPCQILRRVVPASNRSVPQNEAGCNKMYLIWE